MGLGIRAGLVALGLACCAWPARAGSPSAQECIDANENAIKLRKAHQLLAAREQFDTCARDACPAEIRTECAARLKDVNDEIPTIVFEAVDAQGNDLSQVEVEVDGKLLVDHLDGSALPLDPGTHRVRFEAPNLPSVTKTIVLHQAEKSRHERLMLGAPKAPEPRKEPSQEPSKEPGPGSGASQRTLGLVAAGAGVVGLALGGYFGLRANSAWSDSKAACSSSTCAPSDYATAVSDHDRAKSAATLSTVFFAAGGAALALGGVLFFTAPQVTPGDTKSAGISVSGVF